MAEGVPIRVAAAVIRRADGAVLLSLRPAHLEHGGSWEFPGGKVERRERLVDGLARELEEELGIEIRCATPVIRVLHRYTSKVVDLAVFEVSEWVGEPSGREGQLLRWTAVDELSGLVFPAANLPATVALGLPRVVLVTPPLGADETAYLERLEGCLDGGVRLVQLRLKEAAAGRARTVARAAVGLCERYSARLMLNGLPGDAVAVGAHGLHLEARRLRQLAERPVPAELLLSAACHNALELAQAEALGVDFAYLSPVHATATHPDAALLGWHGLRRLAGRAVVPVFALGGMQPADLRFAVRAGCQGVAMMSGLWDSADPAQVIAGAGQAIRAAAYTTRPRRTPAALQ